MPEQLATPLMDTLDDFPGADVPMDMTRRGSGDHDFQPQEASAAEAVFTGVYQKFAEEARSASTERTEFIDGQETVVRVNPAAEFVRERFEGAAQSIEPFESVRTAPQEIRDRFIDEAKEEAKNVYGDNQFAIGVRTERSQRMASGFVERAAEMFQNGETDALTIKVFFDRIDGLKYGLSQDYNILIGKTDEPMPDSATQDRYAHTVHGLLAGKENVAEQANGGFLHVNGEAHLASGADVTERFYISPKLNGQPEVVVQTWADTLEDLGLGEKLYYKVGEGLARRYDTVIAYATDETAPDMEKAVEEFARRCPPELLSDTAIPTGLEVAKGVARAPEPTDLNTLLRYRGKEAVSYNQFACGLTELALRRASHDFKMQGAQPEQVTPRALSEAAAPYFEQFVALSGIDPRTMKAA
jgi:hypothetical protein